MEGADDLLSKDLCDLENGVLNELHHFWSYLPQGVQSVVALVHMLSAAQEKNPGLAQVLELLAALVSGRVPQTAYFVAQYLADGNKSLALNKLERMSTSM